MIHKWISIACLVVLLLVSGAIMSEDEAEELLPSTKISFLLALFIPLVYVALH